jgi:hypothetical protein
VRAGDVELAVVAVSGDVILDHGARGFGGRDGNAGAVQSAPQEHAITQHPSGTYRVAAADPCFLDGGECVERVGIKSALHQEIDVAKPV